jgi:hypothetical protein
MLNSLANHGYLPRNGRNVHAGELTAAISNVVGFSSALGALFSHPIFLEHKQPPGDATSPPLTPSPRSCWGNVWHVFCNPSTILFRFGMRRPGQKDAKGKKCLNLDQLALPNVIEHDISLTRRDYQQGDNITPQPDLVQDLLASSSDGGETLTAEDLAALRRRRIATQKEVNPGLLYGPLQHTFACMEIALLLHVFGDGKKVRCDFARAFFLEERLPVREGWTKRRWWNRLGIFELSLTAAKIKGLVGVKV